MSPKSRLKSLNVFLIVIVVILLLIFFNWQGWLGAPKNIVYRALSPFLKASQWVGNKTNNTLSFFVIIKDLAKENYSLRLKNQFLLQENSAWREAARENELLRQRLELGEPAKNKVIFAQVIGYNPQIYQYLLIDKGKADGLAVNQAVVNASNFLIGKVAETDLRWAKILLITDGNSSVNALTQETRANGMVKGVHGLGIIMEMIPAAKEIRSGEMVLTSGLDAAIPKGLIIGQVSEIIFKETEIFQKASLRPAADFEKLEEVFVIK